MLGCYYCVYRIRVKGIIPLWVWATPTNSIAQVKQPIGCAIYAVRRCARKRKTNKLVSLVLLLSAIYP